MSVYLVKSTEQAALLADSYKMKLIEQFAGQPITTKQVAEVLGEKAPKLYRHVDALVAAGLLTLVEERPKRGTVERYYQAVATRFEIDPNLFVTQNDDNTAVAMLRQLFRESETEMLNIAESVKDSDCEPMLYPLAMKLTVEASQQNILMLRQKLQEWIDDCEALADKSGQHRSEEEMLTYKGLITFYPAP